MSELFELGRQIRTEVLGPEAVRRRLDEADDFNRDFQALVTEYCWGAGWGRTALSRRDRSLMNLGMLSALNRPDEFELHVAAALKNGVTPDVLEWLRLALLRISGRADSQQDAVVFVGQDVQQAVRSLADIANPLVQAFQQRLLADFL